MYCLCKLRKQKVEVICLLTKLGNIEENTEKCKLCSHHTVLTILLVNYFPIPLIFRYINVVGCNIIHKYLVPIPVL